MRFISYFVDTQTRFGAVDGDSFVDMNQANPAIPPDLAQALATGIDLHQAAREAFESAPRQALSGVRLAPVVPRPGKIICLGLNYYDHAKEGGRDKPTYPWFFLRSPTSLMADHQAGIRPRVSTQFDYEAELALVIGQRSGRYVSRHKALDLVFGYTCFNDMSLRDYQKKTPQWTIGKNFDATGGFGPQLVTSDELPPGGEGLSIQLRLNGTVLQNANTSDMIFGVAETIELLTEAMTLEPGDVIVMGTPAGVGFARTPPVWMQHDDLVEVEIERVGTLVNPIRDEEDSVVA
jgi:2-keto-4-pentenoate hydratase/2-oxohepta-3-ene-1,7-dioic acid hydratase in catechol pathway